MEIGRQGLDLIKHFESFRGLSYQDQAGVWTIGYGTTLIEGRPVAPGSTCTKERALELLAEDTKKFSAAVDAAVDVCLKQHEFDALVSFTYNVGAAAFRGSTLRKHLNAGYPIIEKRFTDWNKIRINGVLTPSIGLTRRRKSEYYLFSTGTVKLTF